MADSLGYQEQYSHSAQSGELVGRYQSLADVKYTQDKSKFNTTRASLDSVPAGWQDNHPGTKDYDSSDARWAISYLANSGLIRFDIAGNENAIDLTREPDWNYLNTANVQGTDPIANGRYTQSVFGNSAFISSLSSNTTALTLTNTQSRGNVTVGESVIPSTEWTTIEEHHYNFDDIFQVDANHPLDEMFKSGAGQRQQHMIGLLEIYMDLHILIADLTIRKPLRTLRHKDIIAHTGRILF
ncbi:MAG: hypothetical protein OMM_06119 [Candidatus Magnetoglobus multicellularis str. Araruama]|uniref:Uncharacterized protein n=1 Tax=Candidatus Magnetoglobus multicellularis str. Araruama TaxID=890399 RepID=A0A1V1NRF8_9BACT|nr:MAG: hypothetical protein OMM_06119 [Candidatus Magnetoglobus multicellularis str. Araruama]